MVDHISDLILKAEENNEIIDLTGHKWNRKGCYFEIIKYKENNIIVKILNKVALNRF